MKQLFFSHWNYFHIKLEMARLLSKSCITCTFTATLWSDWVPLTVFLAALPHSAGSHLPSQFIHNHPSNTLCVPCIAGTGDKAGSQSNLHKYLHIYMWWQCWQKLLREIRQGKAIRNAERVKRCSYVNDRQRETLMRWHLNKVIKEVEGHPMGWFNQESKLYQWNKAQN